MPRRPRFVFKGLTKNRFYNTNRTYMLFKMDGKRGYIDTSYLTAIRRRQR